MRIVAALALGSSFLIGLAACESDTEVEASSNTSSSGTGQTTGVGGSGGSGSGVGAGGGMSCGGLGGAMCGDTSYCDYPRNDCGATDASGVCTARPGACTDDVVPVCGCDGMIHSNACNAFGAGTDLSALGGCTVDPGFFACGYRICNAANEYCLVQGSDVGSEPDFYSCEAMPAMCQMMAVPNCLCHQSEWQSCSGTCMQDGTTGGITITCPGG